MSINYIARHISYCNGRAILPIILSRWLIMSGVEKRIGAIITEIRLARGWTQAQLAEQVHLSVESISRLERGVNIPSLKTIDLIANTLDVRLVEFFDFENQEPVDKAYERELSKLIAFLRKLSKEEIALVHKILKAVFRVVKDQV